MLPDSSRLFLYADELYLLSIRIDRTIAQRPVEGAFTSAVHSSILSPFESFHACAVQKHFDDNFFEHLQAYAYTITKYDLWRAAENEGSIKLEISTTRMHGRYGAALLIHSVVAASDGDGFGTMILQACRQMVRTNLQPDADAFIFFWAVKIKWWKDRADESVDAKASLFQLYCHDPEKHDVMKDCVPRSIVCRYEGHGHHHEWQANKKDEIVRGIRVEGYGYEAHWLEPLSWRRLDRNIRRGRRLTIR